MTITSPFLQLFLIYIYGIWLFLVAVTFDSEEPHISVAEEEFHFNAFSFKALLNVTRISRLH